jgi:hypothetical protein
VFLNWFCLFSNGFISSTRYILHAFIISSSFAISS